MSILYFLKTITKQGQGHTKKNATNYHINVSHRETFLFLLGLLLACLRTLVCCARTEINQQQFVKNIEKNHTNLLLKKIISNFLQAYAAFSDICT